MQNLDSIAIRFPPLESGPTHLRGTRPIVVLAEQDVTGARFAATHSGDTSKHLEVGGEPPSLSQVYAPRSHDFRSGPSFGIAHTIFMIDRSGSMAEPVAPDQTESKMSFLRRNLQRFVSTALPELGGFSFIDFQSTASIREGAGPSELGSMLTGLNPVGGTNFESAFLKAKDRLMELHPESRKLIVLLTDGKDDPYSRRASARLAQDFQRYNATTIVVGLGADYDFHNIIELAGRAGASGWTHAPRPTGDDKLMGPILTESIRDVEGASHYLKVLGTGSIQESFALTPAMRRAFAENLIFGYQRAAKGIIFERQDNLKLTLTASRFAGDRDAYRNEISIVDADDAGAHYERLATARESVGLLLVFLSQISEDKDSLLRLRDEFSGSALSEVIDESLSSLGSLDGSDSSLRLSGRSFVSGVSDLGTLEGMRVNDHSVIAPRSAHGEINEILKRGDNSSLEGKHFDRDVSSPRSTPGIDYPHVQIISGGSGVFDLRPLEPGTSIRVGRMPEVCSVLLSSEKVSRVHLEIALDKDGKTFKVRDLESRNGTFVNGDRLAPMGWRAIKDTDTIALADAIIRVGSINTA